MREVEATWTRSRSGRRGTARPAAAALRPAPAKAGLRRRVVEGVRRPVAASSGSRSTRAARLVAGSTVDRARPAQDAGRGQRLRVERTTTDGSLGHPGDGDDGAGPTCSAVEFGERASRPRRSTRPGTMRKSWSRPARPGDGHDRAVGEEPVRRTVEDPGRVRELGLHRRERLQPRALDQPVQVPPAAPVADEMEDAVGRPLGLGDGLVRATGGEVAIAERAVGLDRRRRAGAWRPTACPGDPTRARHSREPSGDRRGAATKSGPRTRTRGSRSPSSGTSTIALTGSPAPAWSSRTAHEPAARGSNRRSA